MWRRKHLALEANTPYSRDELVENVRSLLSAGLNGAQLNQVGMDNS